MWYNLTGGQVSTGLALFTLALNTHLPSISLALHLCPKHYPNSIIFSPFPELIFILIHFLFLFFSCSPSVHLFLILVGFSLCKPFSVPSCAPIRGALLLPLLTNASVRPSTTQVCHKQVGGTEREREKGHTERHRYQLTPGLPHMHTQSLAHLQKDIRHKVQTPASAGDKKKQMRSEETQKHPQYAHIHRHIHSRRNTR